MITDRSFFFKFQQRNSIGKRPKSPWSFTLRFETYLQKNSQKNYDKSIWQIKALSSQVPPWKFHQFSWRRYVETQRYPQKESKVNLIINDIQVWFSVDLFADSRWPWTIAWWIQRQREDWAAEFSSQETSSKRCPQSLSPALDKVTITINDI